MNKLESWKMCGNHHHPSIYIYISHPGTPFCLSGGCYTQTWFYHMKPQYITVMSKKTCGIVAWCRFDSPLGPTATATKTFFEQENSWHRSRSNNQTSSISPETGCINHETWRLLALGKHYILTDSSILGDTVLSYNHSCRPICSMYAIFTYKTVQFLGFLCR